MLIVFLIAFAGVSPLGKYWIGSEGSLSYATNTTVWSFTGNSGAATIFLLIPFVVIAAFSLALCLTLVEKGVKNDFT